MSILTKRLLPLALLPVLCPFAASATVVESLQGRWAGTGTQGEHTWSMEITTGEDGMRVDYPSLGCGGTLTTAADADAPEAELAFDEKLDYGHDNCIDNGTVRLRGTADGLEYRWSRTPDSPVEATGTLQLKSKALD